jgi:phospholipid/cholesterol/gamma-HCH transport system substrate-binding protein
MTGRRLLEALVGLLYIGLIGCLVALSIMIYNKDFTSFVTVTIRTDSVGSALQAGSDVKVRGVLIGSVKSISTDGSGAEVHVRLNPAQAHSLPANMTAQLLPKTLFGERYVDLDFPSVASAQHLRSGDVIEQNRSASAIELERLFGDLLPVLQAVQPQKLDATLSEIASALRGRGEQIAATLKTVSGYLHALAPAVPTLTHDIDDFAIAAKAYSTAAPEIVTALNGLTTLGQTLVHNREEFSNLLTQVTSTSHTIGGFIDPNSNTIIALSDDSLPSLQILAKYASEFPCLSKALVDYIPRANAAFGVGTSQPGAHVILHVVPASSKYRAGIDTPSYDSTASARCPALTASGAAATRTVPAATTPATAHTTGTTSGTAATTTASESMGSANSPGENELINELVGASTGQAPGSLPQWSSLLLGPALRGTTVSLR